MEKEYHILLVEDSGEDAALNEREIRKVLTPCRFLTAETREGYENALDSFVPDIVVSDFLMPAFDGLSVLRITRERTPFTPVIIVTGSINEETAVNCIKAGAADYILKDNLKRLGPSLLAALQQKDSRIRHYETQRALLESEERFRLLAENARDLIYRYEFVPRRGFSYVSPSSTRLTGYTPEEHYADADLGLKLVHPDDREILQKASADATRNAEPVVLRWVRKDGTVLWTEQRNVPIFDAAGTLIALEGIARDISARKNAEEALRASEEQYRVLFENDPAGDFVAGADGIIAACNRAFAAALGFQSPGAVVGLNFFQFCRQPDAAEDFLQILAGGRRVENLGMELVRRDGQIMYARMNAYAEFDAGRRLSKIAGFFIDETERRRLEERLSQAQKMESLGTLAGGVAHDFNNVLNIVIGYLSLLENAVEGREDAARLIETIRQAAERGAALVRQLLTVARKNEPRLDPVRLCAVVGEVVKLARETFPKKIEIVDACEEAGAPLITADADQLHQTFLNLFVNARDAMPGGGTITVRNGKAGRRVLAARYPGTDAEEYAWISVEDTGTGMDENVKKRIFEPFFTTKGRDKGTGLGLALVYGIVKKHRGYIEVESEAGRGSTFTVYLPVRTEADRPEAMRTAGAAAAGGSETILLAEDEITLRDYVATVLRAKGYRVLAAADGEEALALYRAHRGDIALFLTDFGLPRMDGGELLRRVKGFEPRAAMVLMSGFIDPNLKPFMAEAGVAAFLQKPFTPQALLDVVRRTLDAGAGRE